MHIIGLTGGIGSGKSEAAKIFFSLGAKIIDLDIIAHDLTTKNALGYSLIIEKFGDDFLNKKKEITQQIADLITERVLKNPEQYFWYHDRFNSGLK